VHEHGDRLTVPFQVGQRAVAGELDQDRGTGGIDEGVPLREPVRQLEGGIVQRAGEDAAQPLRHRQAGTTTFSLTLIAVSLTAPLLVFALPRRLRPPVDAASTSSVRLPAGPPGRTDSPAAELPVRPPATSPISGRRHHRDAEG
jgi:hypothetical protein